jgi:TolB-like protein/DNA-binding winged helix-turn-helix (wHTH) protein
MAQRPVYRFDDFLADPETWRLSRDGQEIHVEPVVLKLLIYLVAHRGRLVTRQELMDTVWGDTVISDSALTKAVGRLRHALGDGSAAPRYVETVHSQGYRFIGEVEELEPAVDEGSTNSRPGRVSAGRNLVLGAVAIVVLILLIVVWASSPRQSVPRSDEVRSLAVLPLRNLTGESEQDYYVDGLQELLITELSKLPGLRVTSRQSTLRYRGSQLSAVEIARELGVDALVEGSLLRESGRIEVALQLIRGRSDEHLWAERYTREAPYVFSLIADMADAIGAEIGVARERRQIDGLEEGRLDPIDPRAVDAYASGIMHLERFTQDSIRFAIDQFETAVEIEPGFALAWGQLAAAHAMHALFGFAPPRESIEIARAAALKAIEADDQFYAGYSSLGYAQMWTGDFDGACESFKEALRLNPSAPNAIHGDADCLLFEGRMDDSVARMRELLTISPFSAMHSLSLTSHLYLARRYDEAITVGTAMQSRIPQFSVHWFLAKIYWQQGNFDRALQEERAEFELRGDTMLLEALDEGLGAAGPNGAMRAIAEALVVRSEESYVEPFDIGETFARAGMVDEALYWLEKAVEHGSYETTYIAYWPHLDVLWDDPRYQELLERVYGDRAQEIRRNVARSRGEPRRYSSASRK